MSHAATLEDEKQVFIGRKTVLVSVSNGNILRDEKQKQKILREEKLVKNSG